MADAAPPSPPTAPVRRSERAHKPLPTSPAPLSVAAKPKFMFRPGQGTQLGMMEGVCFMLNKHGLSDPALVALHKLCFGRPGKSIQRKKDLRLFSGIVDENRSQVHSRVQRIKPMRILKTVADILRCTPEGPIKQESLADAVTNFLMCPVDTKKPLPSTPAKKASAKSKRAAKATKSAKSKKSKEVKIKSPPNAYRLFSKERTPHITKKHPDWRLPEISARLSKEWGRLEAADKKPFEKQAKKLKEKYLAEMEEAKKRSRKESAKKKQAAAPDTSDSSDGEKDSDASEPESEQAESSKKTKKPASSDDSSDEEPAPKKSKVERKHPRKQLKPEKASTSKDQAKKRKDDKAHKKAKRPGSPKQLATALSPWPGMNQAEGSAEYLTLSIPPPAPPPPREKKDKKPAEDAAKNDSSQASLTPPPPPPPPGKPTAPEPAAAP